MSRLWRWLAGWWRSGYWSPPKVLYYRKFVKGVQAIHQGTPVGICGLHLIVNSHTGQVRERELVSAGAALDRGEFWRCWKYFGGQVRGWVDEDGNEVDLTA